jgi:hypothetical protein
MDVDVNSLTTLLFPAESLSTQEPLLPSTDGVDPSEQPNFSSLSSCTQTSARAHGRGKERQLTMAGRVDFVIRAVGSGF